MEVQIGSTTLASSGGATSNDGRATSRTPRFHKNKIRLNVMREHQKFVFSDTLPGGAAGCRGDQPWRRSHLIVTLIPRRLGVVRSRDGRLLLAKTSRDYPAFMELLCRWLCDSRQPFAFPFTSISLNFDYAARLGLNFSALV